MAKYPKTIKEIQAGLKAGEFTALELIEYTYKQIEAIEPKVKAFLALNKEEAIKQAKAADKRGYGEGAPLLNGVPIAIKDNILTEGLETTAASKMLEGFIPTYDATVIARLKEAGAVIVGKLNMDEFAMGSTTETSYFHPTANPWNLEHVPGGSSGGSAAAVASREVPASLGTDTGGSIRQPSAFNGVVGMKPTYGMVSRLGAIAFGSSLDQVGPITLNVSDNALLLQAIAGEDELDSMTLPGPRIDFSEKIGQSIKGMKIAFPKEFKSEKVNSEIRKSMEEAAAFFESQGAIVEEVSLPNSDYGVAAYYIISSAEGSANLQRFDGIRYGYRSPDAKDLEEVYVKSRTEGFGTEVKSRIVVGTYSLGAEAFEMYFEKAARIRTLIKQDFARILKDYDVIMGPTTINTAPVFGSQEADPVTKYVADLLTVPSNLAGIPSLSIPAGFDSNNMPIGMQLTGKPESEATLYQVAYAFESNHDYVNQAPEL